MAKMKALQFRVTDFKNIADSGWIDLEAVTAFVGRNESGKTALLKALHKFNPAIPEPYDRQKEYPRDRLRSEYEKIDDVVVCAVRFELGDDVRKQIGALAEGIVPPSTAIVSRYYDGVLETEFDPPLSARPLSPASVIEALRAFGAGARRMPATAESPEETLAPIRSRLAAWADERRDALEAIANCGTPEGAAELKQVIDGANAESSPPTADLLEALIQATRPILVLAQAEPLEDRAAAIVERSMPVFIYFEDYGVLDSAVYLPRFIEDVLASPHDPRVRTINAMFKHVNLPAQEIADLGREETTDAVKAGTAPDEAMIARDQERKEKRAIFLNAASLDITNRFSAWWQQRRHAIDYQADGPYFRIWISDDRRPGVKLELESRSKGFQWFFSFYLVFLVESEEGHKDAVLLLDEPGLHLHPTAQQELISFFEKLAETNQIVYSTHSPFLIDAQHIHRVRPVVESEDGISHVSQEVWPADRDTIFPLQAAAGYQMMQELFKHKKNVLVEGLSDYLYIQAFSLALIARGKPGLPDEIHIVPCGGAKNVSPIASLFLGETIRPLVLLDADDAGRGRKGSLLKDLYAGRERAIVLIAEILEVETDSEMEDLLDEATLLGAVKDIVGKSVTLAAEDRTKGTLPDQIAHAAGRKSIVLPEGWRAEAARRIVTRWASDPSNIPSSVLDHGERLLATLRERMAELGV
jgi:predicted ATP-dependent endonuclease of OLD family